MAQKYGSTVKNLTLTFLLQFFLVFPIYVERPPLEWWTSKLIVTVTLTVTVTVTGIPLTFWKLIKFRKIFFHIEIVKKYFWRKHMSNQTYNQPYFSNDRIFHIFFCIFCNFLNFFSLEILKKLNKFSHASTAKFCYTTVKIGIFPPTCDIFCAVEKSENHQKVLCLACGNGRSFFPWNPVFSRFGFSLNNSVAMHPNGPKCIRNDWIPSLLGQDRLWLL